MDKVGLCKRASSQRLHVQHASACVARMTQTILVALALIPLSSSAVVMSSATSPQYKESLAARGEWTGVLPLYTRWGNCTAALIDLQHALTATHCFYGGQEFRADGVALLAAAPGGLKVSKVMPLEGYDPKATHQRAGQDLSVLLLAKPVAAEKYETYKVNNGKRGEGIVDETDPKLKTVKVGNGTPGNGAIGADRTAVFDRSTRIAQNVVDDIGDGLKMWNSNTARYRDINGQPIFVRPPANTLVYDFDDPNNKDPAAPETSLKNRKDGSDVKTEKEGLPAPGDSGGPLFQFNEKGEPILIGVTSSSLSSSYNSFIKKPQDPSVANSAFGDIAFDTRVQSYFDFIKKSLELKPNGRQGAPAAGSKESGAMRFNGANGSLSFTDVLINFANFDGSNVLAPELVNDPIYQATLSVGGFTYSGDWDNGILFTGGLLRIHRGSQDLLMADVPRLLIDTTATEQFGFNYWGEVGDPEPLPSSADNSALLEALIRLTRRVDFPLEIMGRAMSDVVPAIRSGKDAFSLVANHSISASMPVSEPMTTDLLGLSVAVGATTMRLRTKYANCAKRRCIGA